MNRSRFGLIFALLGTLSFWGCAQNPTGAAGAKASRLQEEAKELATLRDQLRAQLKTTQADRDTLQEEVARLRSLVKERDEQLSARTSERDLNAANLDVLKKGLKSLMDQATGMGPTESAPIITASAKQTSGS